MATVATTVQVDYAAPSGCPDQSAFVTGLLSRVPSARVATENADVRVRVNLASHGESSLLIEIPEGSSRREIFGSCQDAVDSMLVIAAMVVEADPAARLAAADIAPTEQFDVAAPVAPSPSLAVPSRSAPSRAAVSPSQPSSSSASLPSQATWFGSIGLGASFESALRNFRAPGVAAGLALGRRGAGAWHPRAAVELIAHPPTTEQVSDAAVELSLLAGRLSACAETRLAEGWSFSPCATFDAGLLFAAGQNVEQPERHSMPWLAPGAAVRLDYALTELWSLEATLGARGLLRHDLFYFRPKQTAYAVAPYSLGTGVNLRAHVF